MKKLKKVTLSNSKQSVSLYSIIVAKIIYDNYICITKLIYIYTYTFEKYNFKQYLNEHKNHFQNVDKTKFNITSV